MQRVVVPYQVATGALSPREVCCPLRAVFKRHRNVRVALGELVGFDLDARRVHVEPVTGDGAARSLGSDRLIVAGGSHYSYFGHDEWREAAPEAAELEVRAECRRAWLTFVVLGAGR
jgi:NADH dehydrogenase